MAKKRKYIKKYRSTGRHRTQEDHRRRRQTASTADVVLRHVYRHGDTLPAAELSKHLKAEGFRKKDVVAAIDTLLEEKLLARAGKRNIRLHQGVHVYIGTLSQHPRGFGFVEPTEPSPGSPVQNRDIFVPAAKMAEAHHGDTVAVLAKQLSRRDRTEGTILQIISQGKSRLGGTAVMHGKDIFIVPDDSRFPYWVALDPDDPLRPHPGEAVLVDIDRESQQGRTVRGRIAQHLGSYQSIDAQMRLVTSKFDLPTSFSEQCLQETARLQALPAPDDDRLDLRDTDHMTIDGDDAKDFDDAILVEKTTAGFRLYVSIADVAHFVTPGSQIDSEAYERGTSVYFPDRVLPMLPERLSNDLCSLVPHQDRLCVTAVLEFDPQGNTLHTHFARSIIRSKQRFTYSTVQALAVDRDPATRQQYQPFLQQLEWAFTLADALRQKRKTRGSIDFNLPEPAITLDGSGKIETIARAQRNDAHRLIEEFMLAANEAVARFLSADESDAVYRIHEPPDNTKAEEFVTFAKSLDLRFPPFLNEPKWYAEIIRQCRDTSLEYIVNNLMLRVMQQARYSAENNGHFGLAASHYTHFTSPIRRYPDLMVHRRLLHRIRRGKTTGGIPKKFRQAAPAAEFLSGRERVAVNAERDMQERLKVLFMENRIGQYFDALISGITDNLLFIEIPTLCISGSISLQLLDDDYYLFDQKNYRIIGEISGRILRLGDPIGVRLIDVDIHGKKLHFQPSTGADS